MDTGRIFNSQLFLGKLNKDVSLSEMQRDEGVCLCY